MRRYAIHILFPLLSSEAVSLSLPILIRGVSVDTLSGDQKLIQICLFFLSQLKI